MNHLKVLTLQTIHLKLDAGVIMNHFKEDKKFTATNKWLGQEAVKLLTASWYLMIDIRGLKGKTFLLWLNQNMPSKV